MAFELRPNASPEKNLHQLGGARLQDAVDKINDPAVDTDSAIHRVRRRCKMVRALARLYRKPLRKKDYKRINAYCRDVAKSLSGGRDAKAMLNAYDAVMDFHGDRVNRRTYSYIRGQLTKRKQALEAEGDDPAQLLTEARKDLKKARKVLKSVELSGKKKPGKVEVVGLLVGYEDAHKAMLKAFETGEDEDFHEWRKYAKYHWYHCRLLAPFWPEIMDKRVDAADELGELLGQEHDLYLLLQLMDEPDNGLGAKERQDAFRSVAMTYKAAIREKAIVLGQRLFGADLTKKSKGAEWKTALKLGDA